VGEPLTYTIRVTNTSSITLTAAISDLLPASVTPGATLTWTASITAPGGVWVQAVPVTVTTSHHGVLTNVVQITTDEGPTAVYTHTLVPRLEVAKYASPTVRAGERLTYTLSVTNTGDFALHATITDVLPDHLTTTQPLVWTPVITAPGSVWSETVVVTAEWGYAGPLSNTVEVTTEEGAVGLGTFTVEVDFWIYYLPLALSSHAPAWNYVVGGSAPARSRLCWLLGTAVPESGVIVVRNESGIRRCRADGGF
jgi:uncharacterized repeat protein (TIGR01451 family)